MAVQKFACPNCGASNFRHNQQNHLVCQYCESEFRVKDNICHHCGTVNQPTALLCTQCSSRLRRLCPECQHENSGDAEFCSNCGHPLEILEFISSRYRDAAAGYGDTRSKELVEAKKKDAQFLEEQSARFAEQEKQRLAEMAVRRAAHQKEQRKITELVIIIGAAIIVAIFLALLILAVSGGS